VQYRHNIERVSPSMTLRNPKKVLGLLNDHKRHPKRSEYSHKYSLFPFLGEKMSAWYYVWPLVPAV